MVFDIYILVEGFWFVIPAYAANGLVTIIKGRHRMDFGRRLSDNQPILGEGKTWEGFFFAIVLGAFFATLQMAAFPFLPWGISPIPLNIVPMTPFLGALIGLGAIAGDAGGSFVKRRFKLKSGQPAPLLDQEDFLVGAFLFAALVVRPELNWFILFAIITPLAHWTANYIGYRFGIKKVPW